MNTLTTESPSSFCAQGGLRSQLRMINGLSKKYDDLYHDVAVRLGVSDSMLDTLYVICDLGEGCTQRDVCTASWISKQTINSCVSKMRKEGLLRLEPGRGKEMRLYLTETGRELANQTAQLVLDCEEAALASMDPSDVEQLIALMEAHLRQLEEHFRPLLDA